MPSFFALQGGSSVSERPSEGHLLTMSQFGDTKYAQVTHDLRKTVGTIYLCYTSLNGYYSHANFFSIDVFALCMAQAGSIRVLAHS